MNKFSTCTYKLQIVYEIIVIIVLVFTTQVTKLSPKFPTVTKKIKERKVSFTATNCCCGPSDSATMDDRHGDMRQRQKATCAEK